MSRAFFVEPGRGSYDRRFAVAQQPDILTPSEAAAFLRLSPASIYSLASRRRIPSVKVLGALRFLRRDLEELVKSGRRPATHSG